MLEVGQTVSLRYPYGNCRVEEIGRTFVVVSPIDTNRKFMLGVRYDGAERRARIKRKHWTDKFLGAFAPAEQPPTFEQTDTEFKHAIKYRKQTGTEDEGLGGTYAVEVDGVTIGRVQSKGREWFVVGAVGRGGYKTRAIAAEALMKDPPKQDRN